MAFKKVQKETFQLNVVDPSFIESKEREKECQKDFRERDTATLEELTISSDIKIYPMVLKIPS